jgi:hypothetical protein
MSVSARAWVKERLEYVEPGFGPLHDIFSVPEIEVNARGRAFRGL